MTCSECIYSVDSCGDCDECFMRYCVEKGNRRISGCMCDLVGHKAEGCPFYLNTERLIAMKRAMLLREYVAGK